MHTTCTHERLSLETKDIGVLVVIEHLLSARETLVVALLVVSFLHVVEEFGEFAQIFVVRRALLVIGIEA